MIAETLPKYIQPIRMADQGYTLRGKLALALFVRLQDLLVDTKGEVSIDLQCGKDQEHLRYIRGTVEASLHIQCQRCLQAMDYPLSIAISLSPVFNEVAGNKLPERYEPLLITEDKLLLATIIEDELLLALPMAPKHPLGEC